METENKPVEKPTDMPPYRWFIGLFKDGTYHFIPGCMLKEAEIFIGKVGGAVYTHAGYLVFASNKRWWEWLTRDYDRKYRTTLLQNRPPHIDVPNIECMFTPNTLEWLKINDTLLKEKGGKYYDNIPKH